MKNEYAKYWDARANIHDLNIVTTYHREDADELGAHLKIVNVYTGKGSKILDVGSGTGFFYNYFAHSGCLEGKEYHMIDISSELANICEEKTGVKPEIWDGVTINYTNDKFDLVLTHSVLMHIAPEDVEVVIDEIIRCSKKYVLIGECEKSRKVLAPFNFLHNYEEIFKRKGMKVVKKFSNFNTFGRSIYLFEK